MMIRILSVRGLSERELEKLRLALDDIRVIHAKVYQTEPKLSAQNLKALDMMLEHIDYMHSRRAIPVVSVGDHNE
jgi:uroporphyrinogen-III synthase